MINDIHWSDDASLDALLHLAHRLSGRRLLLLLTYRVDETAAPLGRFLLALNRARLSDELALPSLSAAEVDAMLRAIFEQR